MKIPSVLREARRLAKVPHVAARIAELELALLPAPEDPQAIRDHAVATGIHLSNTACDERVRLASVQWLEVVDKANASEQEKLLKDLRALYLRAVSVTGAAEPPAREMREVPPPLEFELEGDVTGLRTEPDEIDGRHLATDQASSDAPSPVDLSVDAARVDSDPSEPPAFRKVRV